MFRTEPQKSKMFQIFSKDEIKALEEEALTVNYHNWSVIEEEYEENQRLKDFFNVLSVSVSKDKTTQEFISAIEAKNYPIYAVQFHPEYIIYHQSEQMPHTIQSNSVNLLFSSFFNQEAKRNQHSFESYIKESEFDIYNHQISFINNNFVFIFH